MANKQHRRHPDLNIISGPFAREEGWLPVIGNGDCAYFDDSTTPFLEISSRAKTRIASLGIFLLILCALILRLYWTGISEAQKPRHGVTQASLGREDSLVRDGVPQPAFLKGVLPKVVRSLAITNVDESLGRYKAEDGYKKLALRIVNRIHNELATGQSIDAMQRGARLMDALGSKKDSLLLALKEQEVILARFSHADKSDYAQPETALDCAALLAKNGQEKRGAFIAQSYWSAVKRQSQSGASGLLFSQVIVVSIAQPFSGGRD